MKTVSLKFIKPFKEYLKIEDEDYWKYGYKSRVKINNIEFSFDYTDCSKLGTLIDTDINNEQYQFEINLLMSYLSTATPNEEDIVVDEVIEIDYEVNDYGIEVIC